MCFFINKQQIPDDRWADVAYSRIVCNVRSYKLETNRTRLTFGGSKLKFNMACGTPTASLITIKLLFDSIVSTPGAKFLGVDLKYLYLNTPLERPEYMRMKLSTFPDDVIEHCKLKRKVDAKGFIYVKLSRAFMDSPTPESSPKNCWRKDWQSMPTRRVI